MRKIAIMGAGQSGLHLAIRLVQQGYQVTIISERTAEEIFNGSPTGGTYLFNDSITLEKEMGIDMWADTACHSTAFHLHFGRPDGQYAFGIQSKTKKPGVSVDQRLKFYQWIQYFKQMGGEFIVSPSTPSDLLACTETFDLVIVSSGKGPLAKLFQRDEEKSTWDTPARKLVQLHINDFNDLSTTRFDSIALRKIMGAGEIITSAFYHKDDIQCSWVLMEIVPGGPMDVFEQAQTGPELLTEMKKLMREILPWDYSSFESARLISDDAFLKGSFTPTVRKPVVRLNSTSCVVGLGDTVILNDPIVGQGGNNAAKMADSYANAIIAHGNKPFDEQWMNHTFDTFWNYSKHVNKFCDIILSPPEQHIIDILGAATQNPSVASDIVNGFNHPPDLFPWLADPLEAKRYLHQKQQELAETIG